MLFGNTLFFKGCMYRFFLEEKFEKYRKLLDSIDFIAIEEENCCGSPLVNLGYTKDFVELAKKNYEIFKKYNVKRIITACPACYYTLKYRYKEIFGDKWRIDVKHVSQIIWELIRKGKLKVKKKLNIKATYHDPCHLGRYAGIYDEPRNIIKALGIDLTEMKLNKNISFCCGGGGGVKANNPKLAIKIGKERVKQALETGAQYLITNCPMCYYHLKECSDGKIKVLELIDLFYL